MNLKTQQEILHELAAREAKNPAEEKQRIQEWKAQDVVVKALALATVEKPPLAEVLKPQGFTTFNFDKYSLTRAG